MFDICTNTVGKLHKNYLIMQLTLPLDVLPVMLTKKQLRYLLGGSLPISHKTLKRRLLRDGILAAAGCTWADIRQEQYLPPHVTAAVYARYKITTLCQ